MAKFIWKYSFWDLHEKKTATFSEMESELTPPFTKKQTYMSTHHMQLPASHPSLPLMSPVISEGTNKYI